MWDRKKLRRRRPSSHSTKPTVRRPLGHESLEPRVLMAANPIHVGVVYLETDYLETDSDLGSDSRPDRFILSFTGGAEGTELREVRINTDKDSDGLSIGDLIFDTESGGRGQSGYHPFKIHRIDSAGNVTANAVVADGGQELVIQLEGFRAGDRLEFTLDVDEVLRNPPNLDDFNQKLDTIASGQEFEDSIFETRFEAPHYEPVAADSVFLNDFGDPKAAFGLALPADEGDHIDSRPNRSAAAVANATQVPKPISLQGHIWLDNDLDLKRESHEQGVSGVEVALYELDPNSSQFVDTGHRATTNANGRYTFGIDLGLMPGTYRVEEAQPLGLFSVGAVAGDIAGMSRGQADGTDALTGIHFAKGDTHGVDYDFAEAQPSSVSGYVYRDDSDDGGRDPSEPGLSGVRVRVVPVSTIAAQKPRTVTTDANGFYQVGGLSPGEYRIVELDQPAPYTDGLDTAGTVASVTVGTALNPGDQITGVLLQGNQSGLEYNFGELPLGSLEGYVYLVPPGEDCDGPRDADDEGLAGVRIVLRDQNGVTIAETSTDATGRYGFDQLPKGVYTLQEFTPKGLLDGHSHAGTIRSVAVGSGIDGGLIEHIVLPAGGEGVEYNFCEAAPATVSGYVYHDASEDGIRDAGEEPIANVAIELVDQDGTVAGTTRTDADGHYRFTDVLPGTYTVREIQPNGYFDGTDAAGMVAGTVVGVADHPGDQIRNVVLRQGQAGVDYNFGELRPASLGGRVHVDADGDCEYDSGEELLAGVVIRLLDASGNEVERTETDAQGRYRFEQLIPGRYTVVEEQPAGYFDGNASAGSAGGDDSLPNRIAQIRLSSGENAVEYDFCEDPPAEISGYVFSDRDGDCLFDTGELPIDGVLVELLDDAGNVIAQTRTDSLGQYRFSHLAAGRYTVREIQPSGYLQGGQRVGSGGGDDSQDDVISKIQMAFGDRLTDYNFCELEPSSISGQVFVDNNGDCLYDAGEVTLSGVRIELLDANGTVLMVTTTDGSGTYRFDDLRPGEYQIRETQPDGYFHGGQRAGSAGGDDSQTDLLSAVPVAAGADLREYNFCELEPSSISGRVFVDTDDDCLFDSDEDPLAGVLIELLDSNGNLLAKTTTDASGLYRFDNLAPGEYQIRETQPLGYFHGGQRAGSAGGDASEADLLTAIPVTAGSDLIEYDFCELEPSSISGRVFVDTDDDCLFDPHEDPLAGVLVELLDSNGNLLAKTTTDASGVYRFDNLAPGEYQIRETQPLGYFHGGQRAGSAGGDASQADLLTAIPVTAGSELIEYDFCELEPSSISGRVFVDTDDDCLFDSHEDPLANARVELLDKDGNILAETTTNQFGVYRFDGLAPGEYQVREVQPEGYYQGGQRVGSGGGVVLADDLIGVIQVGPGEALVEYDFCEHVGGTLAGRVWSETDLNRQFNPGEKPLSGIKVELLDVEGNVLRRTQTAAAGSYEFRDLAPGTYSVREIQPDGFFHGGQVVGSAGGTSPAADLLTSIQIGSSMSAVEYNFPEVPPATITGYVFQDGPALALGEAPDADQLRQFRDGTRKPGDAPLSGVSLELRTVAGTPFTADLALPGAYADGPIRVVTNADGYYEFTGLRPGSYHIYQVQPAGYVDGLDTAGTTGGKAVNPADIPDDIDLQFIVQTLVASDETDPRDDAILNVALAAGGRSDENNFSEIIVQPLPPPLPPIEEQVSDRPTTPIETFPTAIPLWSLVQPNETTRPTIYDFEYSVTWHLSVINGGQPRGEGLTPSQRATIQQVSTTADEDEKNVWHLPQHQRGEWTLLTRDGERLELSETISLGAENAIPLAGDFNGDGRSQLAIFVAGQWFIDMNGNGRWDAGDLWVELGNELDRPVVGDWDGDGKDDIGIFGPEWHRDAIAIINDPGLPAPTNMRRMKPKNTPPSHDEAADGERRLQQGAKGALRADLIDHVFRYGEQPDIPLAGDWNGDGIDAIAVFRAGHWMLDTDGDGRWTDQDEHLQFGEPGDQAIVGDWNGDGIDDLGVIRGNEWILDSDGDRRLTSKDERIEIPSAGDGTSARDRGAVSGDWNGDGRDEPAIYQTRPAPPDEPADEQRPAA